MPVKYIPYFPDTVEGQAILNNFVRTRRALKYRDSDKVLTKLKRGMPYYEVEKTESVGNNPKNMLIRGECISACAYLKEKGIKIDLVYIDPPFASAANYAKNVFVRRNPKIAEAIEKAEEEMEIDDLKAFEEKMYGDIWNKDTYLNWMYENLFAIKEILSDEGSIYMHLDWNIGHYVKILMDEVFGEENFINEVAWCYRDRANRKEHWNKKHDTIFWYSKNEGKFIFNVEDVRVPYRPEYIEKFKYTDEKGKYYIRGRNIMGSPVRLKDGLTPDKEKKYPGLTFRQYLENGSPPLDWWEIPILNKSANEREDYPTQKPSELLERIVKASSNKNSIVADFFGGSGVTAEVANDLKRNFIHCDVGVNSIQTTRDRLIAAKAEFDILEIKDGVNLFRNPVQTMDKLKTMILGLRNEDKLDKFWEGAIQDSKLGTIPIYLPNLLDHTTKVLDIPLMNRVINEAVPDLPDSVKKVIVFYIDIDDEKELKKFIKEQNILVEIELRDLKEILDDVIVDDIAEYKTKEKNGEYEIEFIKFISDRLRQKIEEYNQKGLMQPFTATEEENGNGNGNGNGGDEENGNGKKKFSPIEISKDGLELIELISLDCKNKDGIWHSDREIKIGKLGYVIEDGKKTKTFWDAKISCKKKPFRMKVRNIAGDELIINLNETIEKKETKTKKKSKAK